MRPALVGAGLWAGLVIGFNLGLLFGLRFPCPEPLHIEDDTLEVNCGLG